MSSVASRPPAASPAPAHHADFVESNAPPLVGTARSTLERSILARTDIKAVDRAVLAAIFDRCRGKAVCWPGNASLATESGTSPCTITRALNRLEALGIVRTVDDSRVHSRRRIVLLPHPNARAVLAELQASPHVRMDRNRVGRISLDKRRSRLADCESGPRQIANPEISKSLSESSESQAPELNEFAGGVASLPGNPEPTPRILRMPREGCSPPAASSQAIPQATGPQMRIENAHLPSSPARFPHPPTRRVDPPQNWNPPQPKCDPGPPIRAGEAWKAMMVAAGRGTDGPIFDFPQAVPADGVGVTDGGDRSPRMAL